MSSIQRWTSRHGLTSCSASAFESALNVCTSTRYILHHVKFVFHVAQYSELPHASKVKPQQGCPSSAVCLSGADVSVHVSHKGRPEVFHISHVGQCPILLRVVVL